MGAMGDPGAMGAMGDPGAMGASVTVTPESPGANCAGGGVKLVSASGTNFVCNGTGGQGVTVTNESAGVNCAAGGIKVQNGASTTYVCNGAVDYTKAIANGTTPQTASFNITGDGTIGGNVSVGGSLVASKGLKPDLDSGWFEVTDFGPNDGAGAMPNFTPSTPTSNNPYPIYRDSSDQGSVIIDHKLSFVPSQMMIEACGALDSTNTTCTTDVTILGPTGYHDAGASLNPQMVRSHLDAQLIMRIVKGWQVWSYWTGSTWVCPGSVSTNGCYTGYLRVRAWR
jgi:hypothetical protein